jgi:hypothetical protein
MNEGQAAALVLLTVFGISLLVGGIFGFIGGSMTKSKGRGFALGFMLGFFLGLIGIIIVALLKDQKPAYSTLRRRTAAPMGARGRALGRRPQARLPARRPPLRR